jgi:hypothetical protein
MEVKPSVCVASSTLVAVGDKIIGPGLVTDSAKISVALGTDYVTTTDTANCDFTFDLRTGLPPGTTYGGTWLAIDTASGEITVDDDTVGSESSISVFITADSGRYQEQTGSFTVSVVTAVTPRAITSISEFTHDGATADQYIITLPLTDFFTISNSAWILSSCTIV